MLVTMRTSREAPGTSPLRSTAIVCGRPTGNPMSSMIVRQAPVPSLTCKNGGRMAIPAWWAATLSLENA